MRIEYSDVTCVKGFAKKLSSKGIVSHARALEIVAQASGYACFHELHEVLKNKNASVRPGDQDNDTKYVDLVMAVSKSLALSAGEILEALDSSRMLNSRRLGFRRLLQVRTSIFEQKYLAVAGKRNKGEVGNVKNLPSGEKIAILRKFGRPTTVITHKSANTGVADFEYVSPRQRLPFFIPMRLYIPYGRWIEHNGDEVWFSRDYFPLWRIKDVFHSQTMDPAERVSFKFESHFWGNNRWPWSDKDLYDELMEIVQEQ